MQFIQPQKRGDRTLASPDFRVNADLQSPFIASLDSTNVTIPGAVVELGDVTVMPGVFHLRFGEDVIRVMESRIHLNGRDFEWTEADGSTVEFIDGLRQAD